MHEQAQYGVAAYWNYKENIKHQLTPNLCWTQEILALQKDNPDTQTFIQKLQLDIFNDRLFVLTPRGDVHELPIGATVIDFAYAVHTEIGNKATGVLINNKIGQLDEVLHNNDLVEIIIDKKQAGPDLAWLKFAKTSKAKSAIRQHAHQSTLARITKIQDLRDWWQQREEKKKLKK